MAKRGGGKVADLTVEVLQAIRKDMNAGFSGVREDLEGVHSELELMRSDMNRIALQLVDDAGWRRGLEARVRKLEDRLKQH